MTGNAIYYLLSTHDGVTAVVGDYIYPDTAPQSVKGDYVVFRRVSTVPSNTKGSVSKLDNERWQVDGYCHADDDRDALEAAIRDALDYKVGMINNIPIDQIRFTNNNGNFDDNGELFRCSQDFNIRKHRG